MVRGGDPQGARYEAGMALDGAQAREAYTAPLWKAQTKMRAASAFRITGTGWAGQDSCTLRVEWGHWVMKYEAPKCGALLSYVSNATAWHLGAQRESRGGLDPNLDAGERGWGMARQRDGKNRAPIGSVCTPSEGPPGSRRRMEGGRGRNAASPGLVICRCPTSRRRGARGQAMTPAFPAPLGAPTPIFTHAERVLRTLPPACFEFGVTVAGMAARRKPPHYYSLASRSGWWLIQVRACTERVPSVAAQRTTPAARPSYDAAHSMMSRMHAARRFRDVSENEMLLRYTHPAPQRWIQLGFGTPASVPMKQSPRRWPHGYATVDATVSDAQCSLLSYLELRMGVLYDLTLVAIYTPQCTLGLAAELDERFQYPQRLDLFIPIPLGSKPYRSQGTYGFGGSMWTTEVAA
ncbi:hypothetical protein B0H19DRAFT_1250493 [Mycena capillaripes]|nr:hypothetical protein B0H19DRAFT_1250493 [Mycena capillaripes]